MPRYPDEKWLTAKPVGKPISGTRIIPFKCPLSLNINESVSPDKQLHPDLLVELIPNLGLIIDLTNTQKYYNPRIFESRGIKYKKIFVEGHNIPKAENFTSFRNAVKDFLSENKDNDKLIGVHCLHGINRTGIMICHYLIKDCQWPVDEAISKFSEARGHTIERDNYLNYLRQMDSIKNEPISTEEVSNTKSTQTYRGFWIPSYCVTRKRSWRSSSLDGMIRVDESNLIRDEKGGYFVHVLPEDIIRNRNNRNCDYYKRERKY